MRTDRELPGAAATFDALVMPHLGDALALARWLSGSAADAEDVVQEACIRALGALSAYEGRGARAWFLTIVRNTCFTWLAKNRPRQLVLVGAMTDLDEAQQAAPEPTPEAALIEKADQSAVEAAIAALPLPFREVVVLRDVSGLGYKEIAAMLGHPIGTVMSRLARGRGLLATQLKRDT